jgi:proton glutamate symport protein
MRAAILKHPAVIITAIVAGSVIGTYNASVSDFLGVRDFAEIIGVPGQLYLFYLQMTVIPIIITAIASSLGSLMRNKSGEGLIKKTLIVFLAGVAIAGIIGIILGTLGKPGAGLSRHTRTLLTRIVSSNAPADILEVSLSSHPISETLWWNSIANFFTGMVPPNVFTALSQGSTLAIVFFSIIFGIAIGFLENDSATLLINLLKAIFEAFQKLINASLYLLPFGLACLMVKQTAASGIGIFMAMSKFIAVYCAGAGILFIISTIIIWRRSGQKNIFIVISALFDPIILALATRNSLATMPSAITCLHKGLGFDKNQINLTLPFGVILARFGYTLYFSIGVFFIAQLYGVNLTAANYAVVFFSVLLAGTATAGSTSIITISMINIVLGLLQLPFEAALVIFMAIDPIIDPVNTLTQVYSNIAVTTIIAGCPTITNSK